MALTGEVRKLLKEPSNYQNIMEVIEILVNQGAPDDAICRLIETSPVGKLSFVKPFNLKGRVQWLQKQIDNTREILKKPVETTKDDFNKMVLERTLRHLNYKYAEILWEGKYSILREQGNDIKIQDKRTFEEWHRTDYVKVYDPDGEEWVFRRAVDEWMTWHFRRRYNTLVFNPGGRMTDYLSFDPYNLTSYNIWKGFAVTPKQGNWSQFKDFTHEIICSGDDTLFNWLLAWMARICQKPGDQLPGSCVTLIGDKGTGKGTFATTFGKIFGQHFKHISEASQLTGRFNWHLHDCIVLFCDEAFVGKRASRAEANLKARITENYLTYEAKHRNPVSLRNLTNIIIASNNLEVIPASFKERRFFVNEISSKHQQDTKYFASLHKEMSNGGIEAMFYDLLRCDISKVDLRNPPDTKALQEQKMQAMDSVSAFWHDCLYKESIPGGILDHFPKSIEVQKLHDSYVDYCKDRNLRERVGDAAFGKNLRKICPGIRRVRGSTKADGKRVPEYEIPELDQCKKDFVLKTGIQLDLS